MSKRPELHISGYASLNALRKALLAVKFQTVPSVPEIPASPLIADLLRQVCEACDRADVEEGRLTEGAVADWRDISNHAGGNLEIVKARLRECEGWHTWTYEQRLEFLHNVLSPFRADAAATAQLISYADRESGGDA